MKSISAHITGFYRSSFHAYTTEVTVDGHRWRLGLRYSKFHEFYDQLVVQEKDFHAEFPPKGTLFFTPKPEERQEQLEAFLQQVLAYYSHKRYPMEVENLLCDLLKVPRHLRSSDRDDDDDVSTSTESVLDEPLHEPAAVEVKDLKEEETEKTQVAETKEVAEALETKVVEPHSVELKEVEKTVVTSEATTIVSLPVTTSQSVSQVADELLSEELEEQEQAALDTAEAEVATPAPAEAEVETPAPVEVSEVETPAPMEVSEVETPAPVEVSEVETPAPVEESEVAEETIEEDIANSDEEVVQEEEADSPSPRVPAVQLAVETEDAVQKDSVFETHLEDPQVSSREETDVELPTEQSVIKPVAHEHTPFNPQADEDRAVSGNTILEEDVKPEEIATSGQASSWIAAYLPKSLVLFFQHRCMKKTNLVVLCVALLLPMAFARR